MNFFALTKSLARPKTLIASIAPVFLVSSWALKYDAFSLYKCFILMFCALMLQVLSNVANDYFDGIKGADSCGRVGPSRLTSMGLVPLKVIKTYLGYTLALTLLSGIWLSFYGGPLVAFVFGLATVAAIIYTAGPFALAYNGLAEPFALTFFGPIPAFFACYILTGSYYVTSVALGTLCGLFALILITINNLRDMESDTLAQKKTLIVKKGRAFGKKLIASALVLQVIITCLISLTQPKFLFSLVLIPESYQFFTQVKAAHTPQEFLPLLKECAKLYMISSLIWSCFLMI